MFETLQRLIENEAQISVPASDVTPRANLYELGMTPYTAIRLLIAVEREFGVELPRQSLKRETMSTMESIMRNVREAMFQPAHEWREAA